MRLIILIFASVTVSIAEKKPVEYRTAKVLEVSSERYTTKGGSTSRKDYYGNIHTTDTTWRHVRYSYVLDTGPKIIAASERLSWRWSKPADITAGNDVQFRECGRDQICILISKDAKEKKLRVDRVTVVPMNQKP